MGLTGQSEPHGGYEKRDISVKVFAWFAVGLAVALVVVHVLVLWLYKRYRVHEPERTPHVAVVPREVTGVGLAVDAPAQLRELRARETALLESYGWTERSQGIARIPITRAMEIAAKRGLP